MEATSFANDINNPPPAPKTGVPKVFGILLVIVVAVLVGYYGYTKNRPLKQQAANKTAQSVTPTESPTPAPSVILVYAAGKLVNGTYPNLDLYINNNLVKSVNNIMGDPNNNVYDLVEFTSGQKILPDQITIRTTNLKGNLSLQKNYLYVDKINIDGKDYLADDPTVYTTYTDNAANYCVSGYDRSHWLTCNGYFTFGGDHPATGGILPTPTVGMVGTLIKIYAAGTPVDGVYPAMQLNVNGEALATFNNVRGDVANGLVQEFDYSYTGSVLNRKIQIVFTNDAYKSPQDRNLFIDHINFNGTNYYTDSDSVYSTGTWTGHSCTPGNTRNKWLNCNGYFQFNTPVR